MVSRNDNSSPYFPHREEPPPLKPATQLVHFEAAPDDSFQPSSTPIYQTATFCQSSATEGGRYDYTRSGNPTRTVLEEQLARLEGGSRAFAFTSGMAAITAVASLAEPGQEILAGNDLYGGTYRLLTRVVARQGIAVRFVDTTDGDAVEQELSRRPRLVLIETPTNPLLQVTDIAALASRVHDHGGLLAVDNSLLSPYLQRPLERGADLVIHSATKYLCGHGDVTAGMVIAKEEELADSIAFYQNAAGCALAPFEAWLLLRGLKTLALRLEKQQASAGLVAEFLNRHPLVRQVHYPGLADHPGRDTHFRQARGAGGVVSFETGSVELSKKVIEETRLFAITVSFGCVSSSISLPACMSHASIPGKVRSARLLPEDLVRISVGIEHPEDLIDDLSRALDAASGLARGEQKKCTEYAY